MPNQDDDVDAIERRDDALHHMALDGITAREAGLPSRADLRRADLKDRHVSPTEAAAADREHRRSRLPPAARMLTMREP